MLKNVLAVSLLLFTLQAFAAEVTLEEQGPPNFIRFFGPIEKGDLERLRSAYRDVRVKHHEEAPWARTTILLIHSPGGSLGEALKIGRWMRENRFGVMLPENAECFSSCVYLLAAGVTRDAGLGQVGIHRPYLSEKPSHDINTSVRAMLQASRAFFEKMNVPPSLADDMFSIPPEKLRPLSEADLERYRLDQMDMAYRERSDLANAEYYGMTRSEYLEADRKRKVGMKIICAPLETTREFVECIGELEETLGLVPVEK